MYEDSSFSTSSPTLSIVRLSDYNHLCGHETESHGGLGVHFPNDEHLFRRLIGYLYFIFGEMSIQILAHFKNWVIYLLIIEL